MFLEKVRMGHFAKSIEEHRTNEAKIEKASGGEEAWYH
jgi:hypothetical protein